MVTLSLPTGTPGRKESRSPFFLVSFAFLCLGGFLLLAFTRPAAAQTGEPTDDEVNAIARQLFCPVCESTPLDVCPTQACAQWRATIKEKLAAGWSEQQIKDYFVEQYGERVLAQPSTRGWNILVWVLPPLALLVGGLFLAQYLRSARRPAAVEPPTRAEAGGPDGDYAARLEKELKKRR